jgi:oxygen-independent coproporphyrinogen-3 oxidase
MSSESGVQPVSLYVHVPFCLSKCAYCDFTSAATDPASPIDTSIAPPSGGVNCGKPQDLGDAFVSVVLKRVLEAADTGLFVTVPSVYVGGGTPTRLGTRLVRLVSGIRSLIGVDESVEFTVETNPDTTDAALVDALVKAGASRFSLGVQSFDDEVLRGLGRIHDRAAALKAIGILRATGLPFSVDLMCGIPGQSEDSWRKTVEIALESGAGHISVYPLVIEEGTPMHDRITAGSMEEPDVDVAASMMEKAAEMCHAAGLHRYEVASYARPGEQSCHNTGYWTGVPYVGIGPSAASMLSVTDFRRLVGETEAVASQPDSARVRFTADESIAGFLAGSWDHSPDLVEVLTPDEAAREDVMLGLRRSVGVGAALAEVAGLTGVLEQLRGEGLVVLHGSRWRPTERGWLLGNEIFSRVWAG